MNLFLKKESWNFGKNFNGMIVRASLQSIFYARAHKKWLPSIASLLQTSHLDRLGPTINENELTKFFDRIFFGTWILLQSRGIPIIYLKDSMVKCTENCAI